jgi:hypothetical protein
LNNPVGTLLQGPGSQSYSPFEGTGADPATALPGGGPQGAPTLANQVSAGPGMPATSFGTGESFGAGTTATSGVGGPTQFNSPFQTLANPGGNTPVGTTDAFSTGAAPFQSFGAVGQATGPGLAGAPGPSAPTLPTGITSPVGPDPTQGQTGAATPGTAPGAAAAPAAAGGAGDAFSLEKLFGGAGKSLTSNPLGILAGVGGLAYSVMDGKKISEAQQQLQQQAASLNEQGKQIMGYLTSGTLPAGLKAGLDQATAAARAKVISNYAAQGQNTDPTQNSALAQQLAMIEQQAIITTAQIGQQLYSTGLQESGLSSQLYTQLAQLDQTQTGRVGQAIASMAAALSGGRGGAPGVNLKIGG